MWPADIIRVESVCLPLLLLLALLPGLLCQPSPALLCLPCSALFWLSSPSLPALPYPALLLLPCLPYWIAVSGHLFTYLPRSLPSALQTVVAAAAAAVILLLLFCHTLLIVVAVLCSNLLVYWKVAHSAQNSHSSAICVVETNWHLTACAASNVELEVAPLLVNWSLAMQIA